MVCVCSVKSGSATPWTAAHQAPPGRNTGVGCHALLQGIFLTQGSDPCLLHLLRWQVDSLPLHHPGSPNEMVLGSIQHNLQREQCNETQTPFTQVLRLFTFCGFIIPPPAAIAFQHTSQESVSNSRVHARPPGMSSQCICLFGGGRGRSGTLSLSLPPK